MKFRGKDGYAPRSASMRVRLIARYAASRWLALLEIVDPRATRRWEGKRSRSTRVLLK